MHVDKEQLQQYVFRYFQATGSHVLEAGPGHLRVKLSELADKDLTNRPLYWAFVERSGMTPQTMTLTFIFEREQAPDGTEGEDFAFGSPRLLQMFSSAAKHGRWTRLYEETDATERAVAAVVPWLGLNCNVQYICDRKRDEIHSLGVNLVSGEVSPHFMERLRQCRLSPRIPPRVHTVPAAISLEQANKIIQQWLTAHVQAQDVRWAQEARERMAEEIARLKQFYEEHPGRTAHRRNNGNRSENHPENHQNDPDEQTPVDAPASEAEDETWTATYRRQLKEVKWQYEPRVQIDVINGGLFFLRS